MRSFSDSPLQRGSGVSPLVKKGIFRFRQAARTPLPLCGTHENERKTKMNKETIRELRERADGMITAGIADSRVRSCVHDIEFDFVRRDGRHDVQDVINLELDRRTAADEMPHVTPDTVVKCPECGATFRVGKALV